MLQIGFHFMCARASRNRTTPVRLPNYPCTRNDPTLVARLTLVGLLPPFQIALPFRPSWRGGGHHGSSTKLAVIVSEGGNPQTRGVPLERMYSCLHKTRGTTRFGTDKDAGPAAWGRRSGPEDAVLLSCLILAVPSQARLTIQPLYSNPSEPPLSDY